MSTNRHAYLILAHKDDAVFHALLHSLDDDRNDIFIHMDEKNSSYDVQTAEKSITNASISHISRADVRWGAWSQINAIMSLLETAVRSGTHSYYHLLSGDSMPIKCQDTIHRFFGSNFNKEFVGMGTTFDEQDRSRIDRYRFFHEILERESMSTHPGKHPVLWTWDKLFGKVQSLLFPRNNDITFRKGPTWWSISDDFAHYVCEHRNWVNKIFRNTLCGDELFIQTLLFNSPFFSRVYAAPGSTDDCSQAMRLIDWKRGTPYTFTYQDLPELINSPMLFARKIDNDPRLLAALTELGQSC